MKKYLVGADEVGRGCLFGPVVAAAVILGNNNNFEIKDSVFVFGPTVEIIFVLLSINRFLVFLL